MLPIREKEEPSELFVRAIIGGGSPAADCEFCGRTHFDINGQFMEKGELDSYRAKAQEKPDQYIPCDGGVSHGCIDGRSFVWGCPCNAATRYERFIWNHRWLIASYLSARAKEEMERAVDNQKIANATTNALLPLEDAKFREPLPQTRKLRLPSDHSPEEAL